MKTIFCIRLIFIGISFLGLSANDYCQKVPKHIEQELVEVADKMGFKRAAQNGEFIYLKKKITINILFYPLIKKSNLDIDYPNFNIKLSFADLGLESNTRKFILGYILGYIQQSIENPECYNTTYKKRKLAQSYIWPGLMWAGLGIMIYGDYREDFHYNYLGKTIFTASAAVLAWLSYNNRNAILDADQRAVKALQNYDDAITVIKSTIPSSNLFERIGYFTNIAPTREHRIAAIERLKKLDPKTQKRA